MKADIAEITIRTKGLGRDSQIDLESIDAQADWGKPQQIITGLHQFFLELALRFRVITLVLRNVSHPFKYLFVLISLDKTRKRFMGEGKIRKLAKVDGRIFWDLYCAGYSSPAFDSLIKGEIGRILQHPGIGNRFNNVFISITKKCTYKCEHCYEWDVLNKKETLNTEQMLSIVQKFQQEGSTQILFTGGEPMLRVDTILEILNHSKPGTDFWVLTSGFQLTASNAEKLKKAGLTGVFVSIDHFDAQKHDQFRGVDDSFKWAQLAIKNAKACNLVVAISICATRSFTTESNLLAFAEFAKRAGVSFIQILEPRDVGHYNNKDVSLRPDQESLLEKFFMKMNSSKQFTKFPLVFYHGYYQRKSGCVGSGNRNLYVDADGDLHACPFCQSKGGNVLFENLDQSIQKLQLNGCQRFTHTLD